MTVPPPSELVVGLLGTSDLANYGELLLSRIAQLELERRLPRVEFRRLAPYGWEHPVPMDGGIQAEPLGRPTADRRARLAEQLDALVIGGGEIIHERDDALAEAYSVDPAETIARQPSTWFIEGLGIEHEAECPTIWHGVGVPRALTGLTGDGVVRSLAGRAYVSVRDERSLARLREVGVEGTIAVVPDPGFLVPRLFSDTVIDRRRRLQVLMGWLPSTGYVVVQGDRTMVPHAPQLAVALETVLEPLGLSLAILQTGPARGDGEFAAALAACYTMPLKVLPATLSLEDIASVIDGARCVVATSLQACVTAMAFRRTAVIINLDGRSKLAALAELTAPLAVQVADLHDLPAALRKMLAGENDGQLVAELQADIDRHFDRIAVIIERSAASRPDREAHPHTRGAALVAELRALRLAHSVRGRQMVAERSALGSALEAQRRAVAELEARLSAVAEQLATQADERRRIDAEYLRVLAARDELATAHHEQFHDRERAQRQVAEVHADLGLAHARIEQLLSELAAERASASGELASAQASSASAAQRRDELAQQLALTEGALSALQRTKTFRVANLPRRVYGRLRR